MKKIMLMNVSEPEETRIAILEDSVLQELYVERTSAGSQVGNIYKAKVLNVEPSIQAAFVDLGKERNGFLHASDIMPGLLGKLTPENGVDKRKKTESGIQKLVKRGQTILVQTSKDGMGSKGPSVTTFISLPGRYLVMMPGVKHYGVSRKIMDDDERKRLKKILNELELPENAGLIVRTAGEQRNKRELQADLRYVTRLWDNVETVLETAQAPACVYQESDLITRSIRDFFTNDIEQVLIDSEDGYKRARQAMKIVSPSYQRRVKLYDGVEPLFHKYGVEEEIERLYRRRVPLKSGGSIVIEPTEALVSIDVNSGAYTEEKDAEETAYKTNLEAAEEIARQLRLRDLGGVVVIDFIDMRHEKHKRELEKQLYNAMKRDRARSKILKITRFGIVQMTRQRVRPGMKTAAFETCPQCGGAAVVRSIESTVLYVLRQLKLRLAKKNIIGMDIVTHPRAAEYLLNMKRESLMQLEEQFKKTIHVKADTAKRVDVAEFIPIKADQHKN